MEPKGKITSWTKLSAAGAPSEFAIRAPFWAASQLSWFETTDGPNGVFLLVDDEINNPQIGASVELVVRRLYAQEGLMRYGLKGDFRRTNFDKQRIDTKRQGWGKYGEVWEV